MAWTIIDIGFMTTLQGITSVHDGAVAGVITVCAILLGPPALLLSPLVPLVAWARVEMGAHTTAQVIAGGLIGALVSGPVFMTMLTALAA